MNYCSKTEGLECGELSDQSINIKSSVTEHMKFSIKFLKNKGSFLNSLQIYPIFGTKF
jgi:hypothetical protein